MERILMSVKCSKTKLLNCILTIATEQNKILDFLVENPHLSIASIASGWQGEINLLHHFKSFKTDDQADPVYYAVNGTSPAAPIVQIIPSRLLNKTDSTELIDIESFIKNQYDTSDSANSTTSAPLSNSIILPPKFTTALIEAKAKTAATAYEVISDLVKLEDETAKARFTQQNPIKVDKGEDDEDSPRIWNNQPFLEAVSTLQHLKKWSTLANRRKQGFRLTDEDKPIKWWVEQNTINNTPSNFNAQNVDTSNPITPPFNLTHTLPTAPDPFTVPDPFNYHRTQQQGTTSQNANNPNQFQHTTNTTQQQSTPNLGTLTNTNQTDNLNNNMHTMRSNNLSNSISGQTQIDIAAAILRMGGSLEVFANSHASQTKEKQKISSNMEQMLLNLGTVDGQNPAPQLTNTLKDLMRSSGEDIPLSIDIMLQKEKAFASPTARFLRGIQKGAWSYETGHPDNCTLINLPSTLSGTPLDGLDISKILGSEDDAKRQLTSKEQQALFSSTICPSRTFHFLHSKQKAWTAITKGAFGEDSAMAAESERWRDWTDENMEELQEKQASEDKDLPCRVECIQADLTNKYAKAAKYGVPSDNLIQGENIRAGILQGTIKPNIPQAVHEALHPTRKRDRDNGGRGGGGGGGGSHGGHDKPTKKARWNPVEYKNRPREFQFSPDKYKNVIYDQMSQHKISPPKYKPGNCSECM